MQSPGGLSLVEILIGPSRPTEVASYLVSSSLYPNILDMATKLAFLLLIPRNNPSP